jgi:hypothetical protein
MATLNNDGSLICMYGIEFSMKKEEINNAINILYHMIKRVRDSRWYVRGRYRKKKHWFYEEGVKSKKGTRDVLRYFTEKNDDTRRIKYWERRKSYEKILQSKRNIWQEKEAEEINKLVRHKEVKKLREAVRKLVK